MSAISGTRRAMKEMADGTIRVSIDIDPKHRAAFFEMFGSIDMPVALAPLIADFEQIDHVAENPKGGQLSRLAGMWCNEPKFWEWLNNSGAALSIDNPLDAASMVREMCGVLSRAELDNQATAAERFHKLIRAPYSEWLKGTK